MLKDHKSNISKNYSFINFDTMFEANKALIELNGKKIPNTNITFRLNWANKHCELNQNLYIGNLPNDIDDITLFNIFKNKYPSIHHVSIMTDKGESKGYGFIQFTDKCDYNKCLKEMDGYIIKGKPIIIRERIKKNN
jgi:RNA recognition motif-containing protein